MTKTVSTGNTVITCRLNDGAYTNINFDLRNHDWKAKLLNKNVNESFEEWHNTVQSTINHFVPERVVKLAKKQLKRDPWITPSLLKSCTKQRSLYKQTIKSKKAPMKWDKYHTYKVTLDRIKRYLKKNYYQSQCVAFKHDSRKLWKMINEITGKCNDKSCVIDSTKSDNIEHYDAKNITNSLGRNLSTVGETYANKIPSSITPIEGYLGRFPSNTNSIYLPPTDTNEIKKLITKLENKYSSGYDRISNIILK